MKAIDAGWSRGYRKSRGEVSEIIMEEGFMGRHAEALATFSFLEEEGKAPCWEMAGYGLQLEETGP